MPRIVFKPHVTSVQARPPLRAFISHAPVRQNSSTFDITHRRFFGRNILQRITVMISKTPSTAQLDHALNAFQLCFGRHYDTVRQKFEQLMYGSFNNKAGKKALKQFEKKLSLVLDKINENETISEFSKKAISSILTKSDSRHYILLNKIDHKYGHELKSPVIDALLNDHVKKKTLNQMLDFKYPGKLENLNFEDVRKKLVEYNIIQPESTLNAPEICPPTPTRPSSRGSSIAILESANSDSFSSSASSYGSYRTNSSLGVDNERASRMPSEEFSFHMSI